MTTKELQEHYKIVASFYAQAFEAITDLPGKLNDDMSLYVTEDWGSFTLAELRYVVDNEDKLKRLHGDVGMEITKWFEYVMDCVEFNIYHVSLKSWLLNERHMTDDEREHLRNAKKRVEDLAEEMREEYGERN